MRGRSVIFVVTAVLLVPFVYASSSIPDVCAVPPAPGYQDSETCGAPTTNPETGETQQTCCWKERQYPKTGEVTVCQTCSTYEVGGPLFCDAKQQQAIKLPETTRPEQGGVLEDPSTVPKLGQDVLPKGGGVLEQPENNMTFSKSNVTFPLANDSDDNMTFSKSNVPFLQANDSDDNTSKTLAELQSEVEKDTAEESTGENNVEEEQDESEETEDSSEEADE